MTTATPSAAPHLSRTQYLPWATGASIVQMLMMIPGYSEDDSFQTAEWFTVLAISLVISLALCAFAVPRAGATWGIALGVLALVSVLVFWAGITMPFAVAAGLIGRKLRQHGDGSVAPLVALGLAALSTVALVAVIIGDAMAN